MAGIAHRQPSFSRTLHRAIGSTTNDPYFVQNWNAILVGTASLMLFLIIGIISYLCFVLIEPYLYGIVGAALLSVMIHPSKAIHWRSIRCVVEMRRCTELWTPYRMGYAVVGPLASLRPFTAYVLESAATFFGLSKVPVLGQYPLFCAILISLFSIQLSSLWSLLWVCCPLLLLSIILVVILSEEYFVWGMMKLVKATFFAFFTIFVMYNMSLDVISVHQQVANRVRSTSVPLDAITNFARNKVLEEVAAAFSRTNVTATALELQETFGPVIGNLSWQDDWKTQTLHFYDALNSFAGDNVTVTAAVQSIVGKTTERWGPFIEVLTRIVLSPFVSIIYATSEVIIFAYVTKFLLGLPHTILFSVLYKAQSVLHPGSAAHRARLMEEDIIRQFTTLFQSFWHITVFHFGLSFSVLKWCGFPLPGLCALCGVGAAIFPVGPKFLTACFIALIAQILTDPISFNTAVLAVAWFVQYYDEWLLAVEGRASHHHSLPPFVIAMTIVCGLMSFGMKGVVLGPLILIVMLTCYKAFGWEPEDSDGDESDVHEVEDVAGAVSDQNGNGSLAASTSGDDDTIEAAAERRYHHREVANDSLAQRRSAGRPHPLALCSAAAAAQANSIDHNSIRQTAKQRSVSPQRAWASRSPEPVRESVNMNGMFPAISPTLVAATAAETPFAAQSSNATPVSEDGETTRSVTPSASASELGGSTTKTTSRKSKSRHSATEAAEARRGSATDGRPAPDVLSMSQSILRRRRTAGDTKQ